LLSGHKGEFSDELGARRSISYGKDEEVRTKTTKPQLVAYTVHKGSYSQLGEVFKKVAKWAHENGYEVHGPPTSIYYSEAGSVPEDELITEVQIPIKRKTCGE